MCWTFHTPVIKSVKYCGGLDFEKQLSVVYQATYKKAASKHRQLTELINTINHNISEKKNRVGLLSQSTLNRSSLIFWNG